MSRGLPGEAADRASAVVTSWLCVYTSTNELAGPLSAQEHLQHAEPIKRLGQWDLWTRAGPRKPTGLDQRSQSPEDLWGTGGTSRAP